MIYVDELLPCVPNTKWRYSQSCHLFADEEMELLNFAQKIDLKLSWFQNQRSSRSF